MSLGLAVNCHATLRHDDLHRRRGELDIEGCTDRPDGDASRLHDEGSLRILGDSEVRLAPHQSDPPHAGREIDAELRTAVKLHERAILEGALFAPGTVAADYRFDSWRATWRWRWIDREDLKVKVGVTAKIRDASIQLRQGGVSARKDNTGFVPLLHGAFERRLAPGWALEGDIDALANAIDALAADPARRNLLAQRSKATAAARFSPQRLGQQMQSEWLRIAGVAR